VGAANHQVVDLGGEVVVHPDTAITHVIEDSGASAAMLARRLGLQSLSDLPVGTHIVKWDWVWQCKLEVSWRLFES
jgi:DNA polymerase lambda